MTNNLPDPVVIREISRIALEQSTESLAKLAEEMAEKIPPEVSGKSALIIFANAIRNWNVNSAGTFEYRLTPRAR